MTASLDQSLFRLVVAPPDSAGSRLLTATILARWAFLIGPAMLAGLWLGGDREGRRSAVGAALSALLGVAGAAVISSLVFEPRPFMDGLAPNLLDHVPDSGFPSDHATLLFALAFGWWSRPPPRLPRLWAMALVLALAVAWARVHLGVHYPSDMLGAALVAAAAAGLVASPPGQVVTAWTTRFGQWSTDAVFATLRPRE